MKTRIVVHIALNTKCERVGALVSAAGRLIPFIGGVNKAWPTRKSSYWLQNGFTVFSTVEYWKGYAKTFGAVRFQRVTLLGETK